MKDPMAKVEPPKVGDRFYKIWGDGTHPQPYHVRFVDVFEGGHFVAVMRYWTIKRGWNYVAEHASAFAVGLYVTERKTPTQERP